ncbi:hypothetical protein RhiirC2_796788 [Rhizophagus irregularis]|uniref:Uncharacterized protein n=1 Tax=Rhizophagus irregularis TaxID=588596 RepID=A0A2N1M934_9GLOM|nr:hypothetical protein RhiirC2_796788 [Rhizophagus irregularis]
MDNKTINVSNIFSITFNAPFETLPPLARIDTAAEKILHLQYPYLTPAILCSIIGIYGLASVIQRPIMSIYPPTIFQLISTLYHKLIEPQIKAYDESYITIMWTSSNGK